MVRRPVARVVTATAASSLLLLTTACGGGDSSAAQQPVGAESSSAPVSQTPSPSAAESESPSEPSVPPTPPLSRFEEEPPVIAARAWGAALARSINKRERDLATAKRFMTRAGQERFPGYAAEDLGLYYPGPQPFTPTAVTVHGKQATLDLCWWSQGFAQDRGTKLPARKRSIDPARLMLEKQRGRWLVDDLAAGSGNCSKVPVKGVGW
jgi:hypothetical protein